MKEDQLYIVLDHLIQITLQFAKWYLLQYFMLFLLSFVFGIFLGSGLLYCIGAYTFLFCVYWDFVPSEKRVRLVAVPFIFYIILSLVCSLFWKDLFPVWGICITLPVYGAVCVLTVKLLKIFSKGSNIKSMILTVVVVAFLLFLKHLCVSWECKGHGSYEGEKNEVLQRRDYLVKKLATSPYAVLDEMPSEIFIGEQFRGEWALYSCSMLSAALVNISKLYPETQSENIEYIDRLIEIVKTPELRSYDTQRWNEDALFSLNDDWLNASHISYLSHLAWMISGYKQIGGGSKYDELFSSICETMNRRINQSLAYNLETYPGEPIYIPDMLVAIVALQQYASLNNGKYASTVNTWVSRARKEWCDEKTGMLVSFLDQDGHQILNAPIKGSYSALNCSYLTYIDKAFANEQYELLKKYFWKEGVISGFKEYYDRSCSFGLDIDAGPIILDLSPSGTAFAIGVVTYLGDNEVRSKILCTAEIAGHTVTWNGTKHYALANMALVGEAIMLAMRTNYNLD